MTNINQMTVGEALSSIRDVSLVIGMIVFGWKARSWFQPVLDFFNNANLFMVDMRRDMQTLLGNHLTHIESDLGHLSGREPRPITLTLLESARSDEDVQAEV